jgi:hypothetical protein
LFTDCELPSTVFIVGLCINNRRSQYNRDMFRLFTPHLQAIFSQYQISKLKLIFFVTDPLYTA